MPQDPCGLVNRGSSPAVHHGCHCFHDSLARDGRCIGGAHAKVAHQVLTSKIYFAAEILVEIAGNEVAQRPAHRERNIRIAHIDGLLVRWGGQADIFGELRAAPHLADGKNENRGRNDKSDVRESAREKTDE